MIAYRKTHPCAFTLNAIYYDFLSVEAATIDASVRPAGINRLTRYIFFLIL